MKKAAVVLLLVFILISTSMVTVFAKRNVTLEESYAVRLKDLGLFYGVGENDFDLERAPTRIEALVMLIRVLGVEDKALSGTWEHPFTDVPSWADKYVGYAYENGLANGVSLTEFGTANATSAQYLTFMLRALGYSDTNGSDFTWDKPFDLARHVMILPSTVDIENFWRADVAHISYVALGARLKNSNVTLAEQLIKAGVFSKEKYDEVTSAKAPDPARELTPTEISEKCSGSVFCIVTYSFNGKPLSIGSGFFISDDGYAITNHHVVSGSRFISAISPDGTMYDKITVIDTYEEQDLALIKIDHSEKVSYLEFGDSTALKQGQKVYAIGSPQGLENTMSEGIISNLRRMVGEKHYMQISVPIDHGSSGGALIDEYGFVVGVTTAGITTSGSDLNFIIPIQYVEKLDKNASSEPIHNKTLYPVFSSIYDFGAFTGISLLDISATNFGYHIIYNGNDTYEVIGLDDKVIYTKEDSYSFCLDQYGKALLANGLNHTKMDNGTDRYENDAEYIEISIDENKRITVIVEIKPECYAEAKGLIKADWYFKVTPTDKVTDGEKTTYYYEWGDGWTTDYINQAIALYVNEISRPHYKTLHMEHHKNGDVLVYLRGNNLLITLTANASTMSISIEPFSTVTIGKHFETLSAYIIKNSTSAVNGKYSITSKDTEDKYMVSYSEKEGLISFAGNVKLPDAEIQAYVRMNNYGTGTIDVTFTRGGRNTVYQATIFIGSFGKNISPDPTYYNGNNVTADAQTALAACVTILKRCEANILTNTTLTLEKIGFKQVNN